MSFKPWDSGSIGGKIRSKGALQWAPTLTAHDPNPPINLEDVAGPATVTGSTTMSGVGALVAAAFLFVQAVASPASAGALNASSYVEVHASATGSGSGDISAAGVAFALVQGATTLPAMGELQASATVTEFASANPTAVGDISAQAIVEVRAAAQVSAAGALEASALVVSPETIEGAGTLPGSGSLSSSGIVIGPGETTPPAHGVGVVRTPSWALEPVIEKMTRSVVTASASTGGHGTLSASAAVIPGDDEAIAFAIAFTSAR